MNTKRCTAAALAILTMSAVQSFSQPSQACAPWGAGTKTVIDANAKVVLVFWGSQWLTNDSLNVLPIAVNMLEQGAPGSGIGGTRWFNVPSEYGGFDHASGKYYSSPNNNQGLVTRSTWGISTNPPAPTSAPTFDEEGAEVHAIVQQFHITDPDTIVGIMLPPGLPKGFNGCGYHNWTSVGTPVPFFVVAYPDDASGCTTNPYENNSGVIAHEMMELINDTELTGWGSTSGECEIGDRCNAAFGVQVQSSAMTAYPGNSNTAAVQMYSEEAAIGNSSTGCVYSRSTNAFEFGISNGVLYGQALAPQATLTAGSLVSWGTPGVGLKNSPGATAMGPGVLEVFAEGTNGTMYKAQSLNSGVSNDWEDMGKPSNGSFSKSPDAASWGAGNAQVWAVANIGGVNTIVRNGFDWGAGTYGWQPVTPNSSSPFTYLPASKVTVAAAGATGINGTFPTAVQTLSVAYFDTLGGLNFGNFTSASGISWTSRIIPTSGSNPIPWTGDPDMAVWAPGRADIFFLDVYGNMWDCYSLDQKTLGSAGSCNEVGTVSGGFQYSPGAVGLGDGRLLTVAVQGGQEYGETYANFYNWGSGGFAKNSCCFNSGMDLAAW